MPSTAAAAAPPPPSPAKAAEAVEDPPQIEPFVPPEAASPIQLLPEDVLQNVLGRLPVCEAVACRPACRAFRDALSSLPFLASLPPLRLLALRHPRAAPSPHPSLHALDPSGRRWFRIPLSFLPFQSSSPIAASPSLLYLWVDTSTIANAVAGPGTGGKFRSHYPSKSLAVCNPLTGSHRLLPPLGSAWSRHGTVLADPAGAVVVFTELAALAHAPSSGNTDGWLKFSLNLPSKPRSPILTAGAVFTLCDIGNPWRSQWKVFSCLLSELGSSRVWSPLERHAWGDVFDVLKRPRLIAGAGDGRILMIGGLRSSFAADAPCSTVLILRLDLATMEWDEAGRMPPDMYRCFSGAWPGTASGSVAVVGGNNKVKVFGGHGRVWFSGKRVRGKLAMWEEVGKGGGRWSWMEGLPGYNEGVYRGFVFDAGFTATP